MMVRNAVSIDELKKLLRGNLPVPKEKLYSSSGMDTVVKCHAPLLAELIKECPNVTAHWLTAAAIQAYSMKQW